MSNRDTQFSGFAKLLIRDLDAVSTTTYASIDKAKEAYELAVARRAYDLTCHVVTHLDEDVAWRKGKGYSISEIVEDDVPDLTEWPKEQDQDEDWSAKGIYERLKREFADKGVILHDPNLERES